jgi:cell division protein FtsL
MNAAARLVHQGVLFRHIVFASSWARRQFLVCLFTLGVLASAFCMIYVTYTTRMLYANCQHELIEHEHLIMRRGQLLLERSTLMRQARVQRLAENQLDMVVPDHQSIVIVVDKTK